jgi:transcriptional regulator with PAS, ATPase and Fis domain
VRHFLNHFNQAYQRNVGLDAAAAALAERFPWPGNVRQFGNAIERVVLLNGAATIGAPELARVPESEGGARPPRVSWRATCRRASTSTRSPGSRWRCGCSCR